MDPESVKNYFDTPAVVDDYVRAAEEVGLWNSERLILGKYVERSSRLLELGCGAGRISLGLVREGFENIVATDFSPRMVSAAAALMCKFGFGVECAVADACSLPFLDSSFDAAVFGFNGLMQIPSRSRRRTALAEIARVLKSRSVFIFTTHDRDNPEHTDYWRTEKKQWGCHSQNPLLDEFGDIVYRGAHGNVFIHSPSVAEIDDELASAGFSRLLLARRSSICAESEGVESFSDDCLFHVFENEKQFSQR